MRKGGVRQRLGKEVGRVLGRLDVRDVYAALFDALADKEMSASDVLHSAEVLGVVCYIDGPFVIAGDFDGLEASLTELV